MLDLDRLFLHICSPSMSSFLSFVSFINDFSPFLCPMVSFSVGVLRNIVVPDMYKALSIHKIRQNTKMPTFYKTLYLITISYRLESISNITLNYALIGLIYFLDWRNFYVASNVMLATEIKHFLVSRIPPMTDPARFRRAIISVERLIGVCFSGIPTRQPWSRLDQVNPSNRPTQFQLQGC